MTAPVPPLLLDVAAQTTLDASGNGSVRLGPTSLRAAWTVTNVAVSVSSNVLEPEANVYANTRASRIMGTYSGSNDSGPANLVLRNGFVLCEWIGGDPGAIATLYLQGTMNNRGA